MNQLFRGNAKTPGLMHIYREQPQRDVLVKRELKRAGGFSVKSDIAI